MVHSRFPLPFRTFSSPSGLPSAPTPLSGCPVYDRFMTQLCRWDVLACEQGDNTISSPQRKRHLQQMISKRNRPVNPGEVVILQIKRHNRFYDVTPNTVSQKRRRPSWQFSSPSSNKKTTGRILKSFISRGCVSPVRNEQTRPAPSFSWHPEANIVPARHKRRRLIRVLFIPQVVRPWR